MMMKRVAMVVALAILSAMGVQTPIEAQMSGAPAVPPGTAIDPAKSFDGLVTQIETLWMGAAKAMPADKYSFAPSPAIFVAGQKVQYDGVRTFAQIVTHTIQANYAIFGSIGGIKPEVDVKAIGALTSKDDIVQALAATFVFAHKAVANVTAANAFDSVSGVRTRASAVAGGVGHAEDEYGQAVEYLRMNGIVPPASETPRKM
jgi:hypothetical protein